MKANTVRFFVVLLVLVLSTVACMSSATPTAAPTATELPPTDTAVPTDTPVPPTDTPVPTPTPDLAATMAVEATQEAEAQIEIVKADLAEIDMTVEEGYLGWFQTSPEVIDLPTNLDWVNVGFGDGMSAADFIVKSDITWQSEGLVYCGLIFRSAPDFGSGPQYIFEYLRLSGLPAWHIAFIEHEQYKADITQTKFSDALNLENGAKNTVILFAEGNEFTVYINNVRQGRFFDYSNLASEGEFAFTGYQQGGASTCTFEDGWVWVLK